MKFFKNVVLFLVLLVSFTAIYAQKEMPQTATLTNDISQFPLGYKPTPNKAPCTTSSCATPIPITPGALGTQVCMPTNCNDASQTAGPDFPGSNCYDLPNPTIWYSIVPPAGTATLQVNITSTTTNPTFAVYSTSDCATYTIYDDANECYTGAAGSVSGNMAVPANGTTILIGVSAPAGQTGNFTLCVTPQADASACNLTGSLVESSSSDPTTPVGGPYNPGEVVNFCYSIPNYVQTNCNWLQGIVPTFGDCWDASSFNASGLPLTSSFTFTNTTGTPSSSNQAGSFCAGSWDWYAANSVQYNTTGANLPAGWYFSTNGDPDNSWGDGNGMCGMVVSMGDCDASLSGLSWQICFSLTATTNCATNPDCSVSIKTYSDGEIGNWTSLGCVADAPDVLTAGIYCCLIAPNAGTDQTICNTGTASLTGSYTGTSGSVTVAWTASSGSLTNANTLTPTFTPSPGSSGAVTLTMTVTDAQCSRSDQVTINVTAPPTVSLSYSGSPYCSNLATIQAPTLNGTGAYTGGTYSSTGGLTINSSTGGITPSTSTPGNYTVTYTAPASGGCSTVTATASVSITPLPTATISYSGPYCTSLTTGQNPTLGGTGAYTGGTYSSGAGLSINSSTGAITPSASTPGSYTVTYTVPASLGCGTVTATASVTITLLPTATISYAGPYCTSVTTPQTPTTSGTGAFSGGTYSSTVGLTINASTGAITPSSSTPGSYTVTYSTPSSGGCGVVTTTATVEITLLPTATISYATPYCTSETNPQNVTLTGTSGGTYSAGVGLSINSTTGAITPSASTPGSYTVTYTIPAASGCATVTATASVTITLAPTATISYAGPYCTSVTTPQTPTTSGTGAFSGGTYSSTVGLTINASTGAITPSSSTPGSYTVTYSTPSSGGCGVVTTTATVEITLLPTATISYATPYCTSETNPQNVTLTGTSGGTYSAGVGLSINSTTGAITPSASTPGSYTVTYTIPAASGCATVTATASVTITLAPTATISYAGPYCTSVTTPQTPTTSGTGAFSGGTYSSAAGLTINASTGAITPSTSTPGTYTVTYSTPSSGGCGVVTTTATVEITLLPTATISYATPYCTSETNPQNVTLTGTSGGTYSAGVGLSINSTTGAITPSASTPGSYTVTYTIPAASGCATVTATASVTITLAPTATIDYSDPFCTSVTTAQAVSLSGSGLYTGGGYSAGAGLSINVTTGAITPSTSTPGTYTVTYTIPGANGCASSTVTTSVVVNPIPVFTVLGADPLTCNASDGSFTISGLDPNTSYTVSYNDDAVLVGPTTILSDGSGDIVISGLNAGTYDNISVSFVTSGCANVNVPGVSLTNPGAPNVDDIANVTLCDASYTLPAITGTSLSGSQAYYTGANGTGTMLMAGDLISALGTTLLYIYDINGACSDQENFTITINTSPTANISYSDPFCVNNPGVEAATLSGTNAYTGGTYSSSVGLSIDAASGAITASTSTPGTYIVTYTFPASGGCTSGTATATVEITALPTASIDYADPFCTTDATAQLVNLTGTNAYTGGSYSAPVGLSIDGTTGDIDASTSTAGTYTVTYTTLASGGCSAVSTTTSVQITQGPTATLSYAGTPYCSSVIGAQVSNLSGTGAYLGGTFSSTAGLNLNVGSGAVDPSLSAAGTYTVTYNIPASGGCPSGTATATVEITALPTASIDYADPFCTTDATAQLVNLTGTNAYTGGSFTAPAGLSIDGATGDIDASTSTAGTYTVTYTTLASGGCSAVSTTTSVQITQGPTATLSYAGTPYCSSVSGAQVSTLSGTGGYLGGTFASTAGLNLNIGSGAVDPSLSTAGTYTVTYNFPASGGCPSGTATATVEITALPTASIDYADPFCTTDATAQLVNLSGTNAYTGGTFTAPAGLSIDGTSGDIDASTSTAGTYTVTYTTLASGGCSAVSTTTSVQITQGPTAALSYAGTPYCSSVSGAQVSTLSGTGAYLGGTFASTAGLNLNVGSGAVDPSLSTAGTYTVTYNIPASGGCPSGTATATVEITALPTASIDYADPFCTTDVTAQLVNLSGTNAYTGGTFTAPAGLSIDGTSGDIDASTSTAGTYTVTYTTLASGGCSAVSTTTSVTVTAAPTASISYTGTPYCADFVGTDGSNLTGTNNYLGGTYSVLPSGLTLNTATGVITPSSSTVGTYTITYSIPSFGGCPTQDVTASVTINPLPTYSLTSTDPTVCNASDATITISGLISGENYDVSYDDDGVAMSMNASADASGQIVITGVNAGTYDNFIVQIVATGCSAPNATALNINNPGAPVLNDVANGTYCDVYTIPAITGTGLSGSQSYWTGSGATGTQLAAGTVITSSQTIYIYDISGTCSDEESFTVTINNTPQFTNPGDQVVCGSYSLTNITGTNLSGNEAYYTNPAGTGTVLLAGTAITADQTIYVYGFEGNCDNQISFDVTVNALPTVSNITGGSVYCAGDVIADITVDVTGSADWTVNYTLDGVAQSVTGSTSPLVLGNTAGVYVITDIADANCSNAASGTQTIVVNPIPAAPTAGSDSTYCSNWTLEAMTAAGSGTFTWYSDASLTNVISTGSALTPNEVNGSTTYYVTETISGCEGNASSVTITITDCEIVVPTAFTPDNDNVNDQWEIVDLDEVYPTNVVYVYNRWGNLVYQSEKGSYTTRPWDGQYNGNELPVASYYFIIDLDDNTDEVRKGVVSIIRK